MRCDVHIPEQVVNFLNRNPGKSFCDPCIQRGCALESPRQVAQVTATLALFPEFHRERGRCSQCAAPRKLTTRAV
jgi:hypothetical protein